MPVGARSTSVSRLLLLLLTRWTDRPVLFTNPGLSQLGGAAPCTHFSAVVFHRQRANSEYPAWDVVAQPTLLPVGKALASGGKAAEKAVMERLMAALAPLRRQPGGGESGAALTQPTPKEVRALTGVHACDCMFAFVACSVLYASSPVSCAVVATAHHRAVSDAPLAQAARSLLAAGGKLYRTSYYGCSYAAANDASADFSHSKPVSSNLRYGEAFVRQVLKLRKGSAWRECGWSA